MFYGSAILKKMQNVGNDDSWSIIVPDIGNRSFRFRFFFRNFESKLNVPGTTLAFAKIAKMQNFGDSCSLLRLF